MNPPRINNDERGFTVNKTGSVVALAGLLLSGGIAFNAISSEFANLRQAVDAMTQAQGVQAADRAQYRRDVETRLRTLELSRASNDERLTNALQLLTRIDQRLERIENRSEP